MSQQFVELVNLYLNNICLTKDRDGQELVSGSIDTKEVYTSFLNDLKAIDFSFSIRSCTALPTESRLKNGLAGLVCFESKRLGCQIPFFGSPFVVQRKIYLECTYGKKYYGDKNKEKHAENPTHKQRRRDKPSKKIGCPAKMSVKEVRIFTDYAIKVNNWRNKKEMLQVLKMDMDSETPPESTLRFLIVLSTEASHSHPIVPIQLHQKLHPDLVSEIRKLVQNSICTVKLIKSHLLEYVKAMFLNSDVKPDPTNCCYYPTNKIIYNHMRKAIVDLKNNCNKEAESNEYAEAESSERGEAEINECSEQWVEIITSSPLGNAQLNDIVLEDILEPTGEASALVSELDQECASPSTDVIGLQQSCKEELLEMDKLLDMCIDVDYLNALLAGLKHLTNCTEDNVDQNSI